MVWSSLYIWVRSNTTAAHRLKIGGWEIKNQFSSLFAKFLPFLMIFQSSIMSSAHSILKNGKNLGKSEEKPCPELFPAINWNFQQNWLRKMQFWQFFSVGFLSFITKNGLNLSFFAKNQYAKKMQPIIVKCAHTLLFWG